MKTSTICAIGNSHLAAPKLGWTALAREFPMFNVDFFGFALRFSQSFEDHVKVDGRFLAPVSEAARNGFHRTSNGKSEIDGSVYSAFAVFGLGPPGPDSTARSICSTHRLLDHATSGAFLISRACLVAAIDCLLHMERSLAAVRAIRAVSDAPIFVYSPPLPTVQIAAFADYVDDPLACVDLMATVKQIHDGKSAHLAALEGYRYFPQPEETLDGPGSTKHEFIVDGPYFGKGKKPNVNHGNQAYGTIVMKRLLLALSSAT